MKAPRRNIGYFLDGWGGFFFVLFAPFVLLRSPAGAGIAVAGLAAALLWWGRNMCITETEIITRYPGLPRRRRVPIGEITHFVVSSTTEEWEGAWKVAAGVTAVLGSGARVPIMETASWSTAGAERWHRFLCQRVFGSVPDAGSKGET